MSYVSNTLDRNLMRLNDLAIIKCWDVCMTNYRQDAAFLEVFPLENTNICLLNFIVTILRAISESAELLSSEY